MRDNNFNLLRVILASVVVIVHAFRLLGQGEPLMFLGFGWGTVAVHCFFACSGYLIVSSMFHRKDVLEFAWARVLRIYPALWLSIVFAVIVGAFYYQETLSEYAGNGRVWQYVWKNGILLYGAQGDLPGVFTGSTWAGIINGSLWTLPVELGLYIQVGILWIGCSVCRLQKHARAIYGLVFFYYACHYFMHRDMMGLVLPVLFYGGALLFLWKDRLTFRGDIALLGVAVTCALRVCHVQSLFCYVYPIALAYAVLYIAFVPAGYIRKYNNVGDYSYGIYVYSFIVQQLVNSLLAECITPWLNILISLPVSFGLAYLSWHYVEKRALTYKDAGVRQSLRLWRWCSRPLFTGRSDGKGKSAAGAAGVSGASLEASAVL